MENCSRRETGIVQRQQDRLQELVSYARTQSKYYAHMYRDVPEQVTSIKQLPVVTKAEMINHFDEWVTDPAITKHDAEAFIADPSLIGHDYQDHYVICRPLDLQGSRLSSYMIMGR